MNSSLLRDFIVFFLLALAGVFLYNCILWNIYGRSVAGMTGNLRRVLFSRLCSLRLSDLECRHSGEIMSIMTNDLDAAQGAYANMRFHASMILFGIIPSCIVLKASPTLGLFIIFLGLSQLLANLFLIKPLEGNSVKIRNKMEIMILVQKVDFRLFHASCILQLACIRRKMPPDGTESRDLVC